MKATKLRKLLKTRQKEPAFSRLWTEIRSNVMVLTETLHELRIDSFNGCVNVATTVKSFLLQIDKIMDT
jgi:hypothetical protein